MAEIPRLARTDQSIILQAVRRAAQFITSLDPWPPLLPQLLVVAAVPVHVYILAQRHDTITTASDQGEKDFQKVGRGPQRLPAEGSPPVVLAGPELPAWLSLPVWLAVRVVPVSALGSVVRVRLRCF
jgi:hypothetical protein